MSINHALGSWQAGLNCLASAKMGIIFESAKEKEYKFNYPITYPSLLPF